MAFDAQESLNALNTDGFVVIDSGLADLADEAVTEFRAIEAEHSELFKREADGRYPRLINFHLASAKVRRIFTDNERALAVQDGFFGELRATSGWTPWKPACAAPPTKPGPAGRWS